MDRPPSRRQRGRGVTGRRGSRRAVHQFASDVHIPDHPLAEMGVIPIPGQAALILAQHHFYVGGLRTDAGRVILAVAANDGLPVDLPCAAHLRERGGKIVRVWADLPILVVAHFGFDVGCENALPALDDVDIVASVHPYAVEIGVGRRGRGGRLRRGGRGFRAARADRRGGKGGRKCGRERCGRSPRSTPNRVNGHCGLGTARQGQKSQER